MSDAERIHEPSPIRLLQAKEEGRVARSAELSRALILCLMLSGIFIFAGTFQRLFSQFIRSSISNVGVSLNQASFNRSQTSEVLSPILFFIGAVTILSLLIWHIQSPLTPKFSKAMPDMRRLSPGNSLARIFSFDNLQKTMLLLVGLLATGIVAFWLVAGNSLEISQLATLAPGIGTAKLGGFLRHFFVATGVIILVLGLVDFVREKFKLANQLKMTDQERRDEARNSEMNPEVRRRLRQ